MPSEPSVLSSIVTFSKIAPGAKFNIHSALACVPLIAFAPVAFSSTQPESSEPSIGQIIPLVPSCALATGDVRIGPKDANNITVTSITALALDLAGPTALSGLFIFGYPNSMVYEANALMFTRDSAILFAITHSLINRVMFGLG